MRPGYDESPINPLPPIIWALVLPMLAAEALFGLADLGFLGGQGGASGVMRMTAIERTAFVPEMVLRALQVGAFDVAQLWRIVTYPFIHWSFLNAAFVVAFTLALGNLVARQFQVWAVVVLFFGSAIGGALVYTLLRWMLPGMMFEPLVGGYPAVYGLVGAFTFLLWIRLGQENANQMRAFTLIGMLLVFQLAFAILFQNNSKSWIAEVAGFGTGFLLSFVVVPGGVGRVLRQLRQR